MLTESEWVRFKAEFSNAYPLFLPNLRQALEGITPGEERLAALIYLNLDNQRIGSILGISKESVARAKRRLKERLQIISLIELDRFIAGLQPK